ncbi:MAG: cation acetate symporter [Robiginitomaculum sp.]|nr:MAG: cation acetate symporter [Robiginitomaculum sp.]
MDANFWTWFFVVTTFGLYIGIAIFARAKSTDDFYVAGHDVPPLINGMATAADWMSAASFISMAGLIAFMGYGGSVYLMGWTGGYVLLALLFAPYLRKFGKFTVPDFVGDRYYSDVARTVAAVCALFISFTYIAGQMKGVGVAFSRFLGLPFEWGVIIGMGIVFFYAVLGGMKGITYTQVAQYCVLIFAYLVPAIFISLMITGNPVPQLGFIGNIKGEEISMLAKLNQTVTELGFTAYTSADKSTIDMFFITMALMVGTAGLPHVIIRFFTVPSAAGARKSAGWALFFIAILYTTAPALGAFSRINFIDTVNESTYEMTDASAGEKITPDWFKDWEKTGLLSWEDKNGDGKLQRRGGDDNEVTVNRDIMVLATPQIANLPGWVIGLVVAGGLAAALSTAAGLLLVISSSVSHDLGRKLMFKNMSDKQELRLARGAAAVAVILAGLLGIYPLGFVAQVVAFAFGLAAASFFPILLLGIFDKRMNKEGAISGMITGIVFTAGYIIYFKFINPSANSAQNWLFGISPEGIGGIGMMLNFVVSLTVSRFTPPPPQHVQDMIDDIRVPTGYKITHE